MKILLLPNSSKPKAIEVADQAAEMLLDMGVDVLAGDECEQILRTPGIRLLPWRQAIEKCDVVVTVGGDGTLLNAARHSMELQKPLLGINVGQLGFLAIVESDELDKLKRLPAGEFVVEQRSVLRADCNGEPPFFDRALNDILLFKELPEKTIALDIYCDDILVSSFRGDGVVFSTPTGSTAYSMSAGGPIVDARVAGFIVTPLCPHIVYTPPMVVAANRVIKVVPRGTAKEKILVGFDGVQSRPLPEGATLLIKQSTLTVPLIQFHDADQLKSIDKKLKGR